MDGIWMDISENDYSEMNIGYSGNCELKIPKSKVLIAVSNTYICKILKNLEDLEREIEAISSIILENYDEIECTTLVFFFYIHGLMGKMQRMGEFLGPIGWILILVYLCG